MAVAFPVMRALLWLGVLVMACSSTVDAPSSEGGGQAGEPSSGGAAGVAGGTLAGAQSVAGAGSSAVGGGASGTAAGLAGAVAVAGGGGQSGAAGTAQGGTSVIVTAGAGGAEPVGGAGGASAGAAGEPSGDLGGAGGAAGAGGDGPTDPVCVCSAGPCCDGCQFFPKSHLCGEVIRSSECLSNGNISHDYWNLFCSGAEAAECTRWAVHTKYVDVACGAQLTCSGPDGSAVCGPN